MATTAKTDKTPAAAFDAAGDGELAPAAHRDATAPGVARIEAVAAVWRTWERWFFWIALFLFCYYRGLDGMTRPTFQAFAVSEWNVAGQTATLAVIRACIGSASQPVYAKLCDYVGRPFVLFISTFFFLLGTIVCAAAQNFGSYIAGFVIYTFGFGGQNMLIFAVASDFSSMRSRLIFLHAPSVPFLINTWVSGNVAQGLLNNTTWRWGFGIPAIVDPFTTALVFVPLLLGLLRAKKQGRLDGIKSTPQLLASPSNWLDLLIKVDIVGLFLIASSLALILVPLTLGGGNAAKWRTAPVLAPLIIGLTVTLPSFIVWEVKYAKYPMLPKKLLRSRHILCGLAIALFSIASSSTQGSYLYFTLVVAFGKSVEAATRVRNITSFVSTIVGILIGFAVRHFRQLKPFIIAGGILYMVAFGLLIRYRGGHSVSDFAGLVGGEVVLGVANALIQYPTTTALQAVVSHDNMAIVTAMYNACFQVGAAIGAAMAGGIWTNLMPRKLQAGLERANIPGAEKLALSVYGNPIKFIAQYKVGSPERAAVDGAYRDVQRIICIAGICVAVVLFGFTFGLDNPRLSDDQSNKDAEKSDSDEASVHEKPKDIK
ncbi:hypothetical protein Q8F55_003233 [Vanrija albida]|uniref:Major facilitator superfamily (MFS) profile domain-containing protein n=1 Tax=Vanrija albida TaxID=181172 RepID=A0ABR3QCJ5_9TREE